MADEEEMDDDMMSSSSNNGGNTKTTQSSRTKSKTPVLDSFGTDLTQAAARGEARSCCRKRERDYAR